MPRVVGSRSSLRLSSTGLQVQAALVTTTSTRTPARSAQKYELLAEQLLDQAVAQEQAVYELRPGDDPAQLRAAVRTLARRRKVKIRTGLIDGVVAVVLADAALWSQPASVMRDKLTPPA